MNNISKIKALRSSGLVERLHTMPHHGSYNVAQHCYGVCSLLFVLHPNPSIDLIRAALWHDFGEQWTGDIPAPIKWQEPELAEILRRVEQKYEIDYFGADITENLSGEELFWLKCCDIIELLLWTDEQILLGNSRVEIVADKIGQWLDNNNENLPIEIVNFLNEFLSTDVYSIWEE